jgi:hypothetical protein
MVYSEASGLFSYSVTITFSHRIYTRPERTLLCLLAEGKRPNFFYVLWRHPGVHTALCTYVFLWKTSVCTPGWRHMMAYFHVSARKISDKISSEWHFWSSIYSVIQSFRQKSETSREQWRQPATPFSFSPLIRHHRAVYHESARVKWHWHWLHVSPACYHSR